MRPLSSIATSCGYTVLVEASPTCIELTGNGRWHVFEHECYRLLKRSIRDHVTLIFRDPLGGRELCDLGEKGERRATLPPASHKKMIHEAKMIGVLPHGLHYVARVQDIIDGKSRQVYLGTFENQFDAALTRDRYVVEHGLKAKLNFPALMETAREEAEMALTEQSYPQSANIRF